MEVKKIKKWIKEHKKQVVIGAGAMAIGVAAFVAKCMLTEHEEGDDKPEPDTVNIFNSHDGATMTVHKDYEFDHSIMFMNEEDPYDMVTLAPIVRTVRKERS